ncbi:MAG: DNA-binding domain-containing protein [Proteobacteria bacterium]|nr:DNA-binding domain-containing protein [Pseudomonadota bacterium]
MNLQTLQEKFIKQLTQFEVDSHFFKQLTPSLSLSPEQQVAVYQNNVRGALQSCLEQIYPVCRTILGEGYFKQLAKGYIQNHPSRHANLNNYGDAFAAFVLQQCQQRPELAEFAYLSDLVKLEWRYHQVYYAKSSPQFDFETFTNLTEQQQAHSTFKLVPSFQFVASDYPILSIFQMNQAVTQEHKTVSFKAENVGVFRRQNRIEVFELEQPVLNTLTLIRAGSTLQAIVQADLDNYLLELIQQRWIIGNYSATKLRCAE